MFIVILGRRPHCIWTWWFVLYIGNKPIIEDIYMCVFVLGMDPEAHDWWDVFCWAMSYGAHEYLNVCVEREAMEHMSVYVVLRKKL